MQDGRYTVNGIQNNRLVTRIHLQFTIAYGNCASKQRILLTGSPSMMSLCQEGYYTNGILPNMNAQSLMDNVRNDKRVFIMDCLIYCCIFPLSLSISFLSHCTIHNLLFSSISLGRM
jgi:hypothetical protein